MQRMLATPATGRICPIGRGKATIGSLPAVPLCATPGRMARCTPRPASGPGFTAPCFDLFHTRVRSMIRQQWIFAVLTFVLMGVSIAALVQNSLKEKPLVGTPLEESTLLETTTMGGDAAPDAAAVAEAAADVQTFTDSALAVGVSSSVPSPDKLPSISKLPWSSREATEAFRIARGRPAELLPSGAPVLPPLARGEMGEASAIGRMTGFTVGLTIDPLHRGDLPTISKGRILDYLDSHTMAIQAPVYRDRGGRFFFGADAKAAFFERKNIDRTIDPQSLILKAVREFRILGIWKTERVQSARTLVLAFRYDADVSELITGGSGIRKEHELLILHLLPESDRDGRPQVVAFATSDGRQTLNTLTLPSLRSTTPSVIATIKFGEFQLGALPSKPIVTGIRQSGRTSISASEFRAAMAGSDAMTLTQALDALHAGTIGSPQSSLLGGL